MLILLQEGPVEVLGELMILLSESKPSFSYIFSLKISSVSSATKFRCITVDSLWIGKPGRACVNGTCSAIKKLSLLLVVAHQMLIYTLPIWVLRQSAFLKNRPELMEIFSKKHTPAAYVLLNLFPAFPLHFPEFSQHGKNKLYWQKRA